MVLSVFLHMARVFYHGAYKSPREFNWVIGIILLTLTLLLSFTGYLLPWDQLSLWAVTVGTNMMGYTPVFGSQVKYVLLGLEGDQRRDAAPMVRAACADVAVRDRDLHGRPLLESPQGRRHLRAALGAKGGEQPHGRSSRTSPASGAGSAARRSVFPSRATTATTETPAADAPARRRGRAEPAEEAAPAAAASDAGEAITEDKGGIPAHLLERSRKRKAALAGGGGGEAAPAAAGGATRDGDRGRRARADDHRSRRSHPATADRRQVGFDPADARRSRRTRCTSGRTCSCSSSRRSCR